MPADNHHKISNPSLPPIPEKRYFAIGEVSELCAVKPHVLRYWEQEFNQIKPDKRRGNRRYYRQQDVTTIRQIRHLLYDKGFTIQGAKQHLKQTSKDEASSQRLALAAIRAELESVLDMVDDNHRR